MSTNDTAALEAKINELSERFKALFDENVKTRRSNEDLLYNLDEDNIPYLKNVKDSVKNLSSSINQQADKISLIVSGTGSNASINAASIVAAINGADSNVSISANHVNLNGYVTISDLSTSGKTTINGDNITTGHISASRISANIQYNNIPWISFDSPVYITSQSGCLSTSYGISYNGTLYGAFGFAPDTDNINPDNSYVQLYSQLYPLHIMSAYGIMFDNRPKVLINNTYYDVLTSYDKIVAVFG